MVSYLRIPRQKSNGTSKASLIWHNPELKRRRWWWWGSCDYDNGGADDIGNGDYDDDDNDGNDDDYGGGVKQFSTAAKTLR